MDSMSIAQEIFSFYSRLHSSSLYGFLSGQSSACHLLMRLLSWSGFTITSEHCTLSIKGCFREVQSRLWRMLQHFSMFATRLFRARLLGDRPTWALFPLSCTGNCKLGPAERSYEPAQFSTANSVISNRMVRLVVCYGPKPKPLQRLRTPPLSQRVDVSATRRVAWSTGRPTIPAN